MLDATGARLGGGPQALAGAAAATIASRPLRSVRETHGVFRRQPAGRRLERRFCRYDRVIPLPVLPNLQASG